MAFQAERPQELVEAFATRGGGELEQGPEGLILGLRDHELVLHLDADGCARRHRGPELGVELRHRLTNLLKVDVEALDGFSRSDPEGHQRRHSQKNIAAHEAEPADAAWPPMDWLWELVLGEGHGCPSKLKYRRERLIHQHVGHCLVDRLDHHLTVMVRSEWAGCSEQPRREPLRRRTILNSGYHSRHSVVHRHQASANHPAPKLWVRFAIVAISR